MSDSCTPRSHVPGQSPRNVSCYRALSNEVISTSGVCSFKQSCDDVDWIQVALSWGSVPGSCEDGFGASHGIP
jgi:hypothetical protein